MNTEILIFKLEALGVGLDRIQKISRARIIRSHQLQLRWQTQKMKPATRRFLLLLRTQILKRLPAAGKSGMARKGWTDKLIDADEILALGIEIFKPELLRTMTAGGVKTFKTRIKKQDDTPKLKPAPAAATAAAAAVAKPVRFDPIGIEAIAWVEKRSAALVVEITDKTMEAIRALVKEGVNAGISMPKLARQIRPLVGLIESHALAVQKLQLQMLAEGIPADTVQKAVNKYARKLHNWRTNTIARTETGESLLRGQTLAYEQMGIKQLQRIEDPDTDDDCMEINGTILPIAEAREIGLIHPNCEGTWVAA